MLGGCVLNDLQICFVWTKTNIFQSSISCRSNESRNLLSLKRTYTRFILYALTLLAFAVAAFVYIGSWTLAGTDFAGVSTGLTAATVLASTFTGSSGLLTGLGGSDGSYNEKRHF